MSFESLKAIIQNPPLSAIATNTINQIRLLQGSINIDKVFPQMKKLMNIPGCNDTFSKISDISQICKGQNDAVGRGKMKNLCSVIDNEAGS